MTTRALLDFALVALFAPAFFVGWQTGERRGRLAERSAAGARLTELRERVFAESDRAAASYARGYMEGMTAATSGVVFDLAGVKRAINTIAAGCVYLPDAERLDVQPVQAKVGER